MENLITSTPVDLLKKAAEKVSKPELDATISVQKALALYVDMDLSYRTYNMMRTAVNKVHKGCFPSYKSVLRAKEEYIPTDIKVTESSAEVPVQSLLNRTAKSVMDSNEFPFKNNITLECKWGFDGSSNHSLYKQKATNPHLNDEFMFVVSLVPLRFLDTENGKILWENDRHSSPRFCRPIKFIFMKESADLINSVQKDITEQISNLNTFHYEQRKVNISFSMNLTMIDGAVLNVLTNNKSCSTCFLCGAKPSQMNSAAVFEREIKEEHYKYGLSTLHARIKFFECVLHIAYKLPVKKWRTAAEDEKKLISIRKHEIQNNFKEKMGLIVDKVKNGYGTTNDGNTARRFFSNIELASEITGVDIHLLRNFSLILRIISSGSIVNTDHFSILLKETFDIYLKLYSWYFMPATVHKVLVHGIGFIKYTTIPIGYLSEEAIESSHKIIRKARLEHTRKCDREATNKDLFVYLLLHSEPTISILSQKNNSNNESLKDIEYYIITESEVHEEE